MSRLIAAAGFGSAGRTDVLADLNIDPLLPDDGRPGFYVLFPLVEQ